MMALTRRKVELTKNILVCLAVAAVVASVLYRTDRERIASQVAEPYARIEIIPDSIEQRPIEGSTQWGLFYDLRSLKTTECDEVVVERLVQVIGSAFPVANSREITGELVKAGPDERITSGLHVALTGPLAPGNYFMLLRATCFQNDPEAPGRRALSPPAEAFVCFSVPGVRPTPLGRERLQPVSENCRRELADFVLHRGQVRFVMSR